MTGLLLSVYPILVCAPLARPCESSFDQRPLKILAALKPNQGAAPSIGIAPWALDLDDFVKAEAR